MLRRKSTQLITVRQLAARINTSLNLNRAGSKCLSIVELFPDSLKCTSMKVSFPGETGMPGHQSLSKYRLGI